MFVTNHSIMSDKNLKKLIDPVKAELKIVPTKEEALQSFIYAGIKNKKGKFTSRYAILNKLVKITPQKAR
ncbi:hypothetical protein FHW88_002755 [Mucilaginibacter sp. SG538B]|uniref:hypothetical protein n=1 Tax=Mucilaginibacter sp. SG538B TaxID=2587021 RepID=UPI00159D1480|nr:hypothetical protein [Mucilaginibacter sp. SG538B]NVM64466.1 hypothetical protein [Mucilaginibacter sp. SG538B]